MYPARFISLSCWIFTTTELDITLVQERELSLRFNNLLRVTHPWSAEANLVIIRLPVLVLVRLVFTTQTTEKTTPVNKSFKMSQSLMLVSGLILPPSFLFLRNFPISLEYFCSIRTPLSSWLNSWKNAFQVQWCSCLGYYHSVHLR